MRDYQPTKNNPYILPKTLYRRIVDLIRDYDRLKEEYHLILESGIPPLDGLPKGTRKSNPTEQKALRLSVISNELKAVEQALFAVPVEYRDGVMGNAAYGAWFPDDAAHRTYQRWKQRFIYYTARNMHYI